MEESSVLSPIFSVIVINKLNWSSFVSSLSTLRPCPSKVISSSEKEFFKKISVHELTRSVFSTRKIEGHEGRKSTQAFKILDEAKVIFNQSSKHHKTAHSVQTFHPGFYINAK